MEKLKACDRWYERVGYCISTILLLSIVIFVGGMAVFIIKDNLMSLTIATIALCFISMMFIVK